MEMIRFTVDLPKDLYVQAKIMAVLTGRPLAHIMRSALTQKITELKKKK